MDASAQPQRLTPLQGLAARTRRLRPALWLSAGVLLVHGLVLDAVLPARTVAVDRPSATTGPSLQLVARVLVRPTLYAAEPAPPPIQPVARAEQSSAAVPARRRITATTPVPAVPAPVTDVPVDQQDARETMAAPASDPVPVYATRLPAAAELHYVAQRGAAQGSAQLLWRRDGTEYELTMDSALPGQPLLGSTSRGRIDADGVAPWRHVERRKLRDVRATNFQRDAGVISFSGPSQVVPLQAGAQDRLSWMVQLPAIIEANPALGEASARVMLFVVGTRGDAEAWVFQARGRQSIELPAGAFPDALHFVREPTRPFDTHVEVWLDPARQHLPVRARFATVPGGQALELLLASAGDPAAGLN